MGPIKAIVCLVTWLLVFAIVLGGLVPYNGLGNAAPWGPADFLAGLALIVGVVHAAPYWRFLPLYFTYGVVAGLTYVALHWPGSNDVAAMGRGIGPLVAYGCLWLGIMLAAGLICRFVASACHDRQDARELRKTDRCRKCGYLLYGLTEPRCPECGQPFDPARLRKLDDAAQALQELAESQRTAADDDPDDGGGVGKVE